MIQEHLRPLTLLRFFAAFWVVLYTYWAELGLATTPGFIQAGHMGVDLFFILSGFILSYTYLESFGTGRFRYQSFLTNRLARIYPLHIATLAFTIALVVVAGLRGITLDGNVANWSALPAHLFLVNAWGLAPTASFNHPSWSISAEWFAYLLFPLFAAVLWPLRQRPIAAVMLAVIVLAVSYIGFQAVAGFSLADATFQWGALRIVPTFLLGGALYLAFRAGAVDNGKLAAGLAIVAVALMVGLSQLAQPDVLIVGAAGLLVLALAGVDRAGKGLLSHPVMVWLGEISFATYMIYVPWKWVYLKGMDLVLGLEGQPLPLVWWIVGLVALIPLSAAAHHLIEVPCRHLIRRMGEGRLRAKPPVKVV